MEKKFFTVTEKHIKLLKAAYVSWVSNDILELYDGRVAVYGNSMNILEDIAEIIGLEILEDADGEKHLSKEQEGLCEKLHCETEDVLQILLSNCSIEAGEYESEKYDHTWRKVNR